MKLLPRWTLALITVFRQNSSIKINEKPLVQDTHISAQNPFMPRTFNNRSISQTSSFSITAGSVQLRRKALELVTRHSLRMSNVRYICILQQFKRARDLFKTFKHSKISSTHNTTRLVFNACSRCKYK